MANLVDKTLTELEKVKAKVYELVGIFLQNDTKLLQANEIVKTLNIDDKTRNDVINRINYLKTNQKNLFDNLQTLTKNMDSLIERAKVFRTADLTTLLTAPKSYEAIIKLVNEGITLSQTGTKLITLITIQNKDVDNLLTYLRDKTNLGKISLPSLEKVSESILSPLKTPLTIFLVALAVGYMFPNIMRGFRGK